MSYIGRTKTPAPLTSADIPDGIITAADLAPDSVGTSEIADSVTLVTPNLGTVASGVIGSAVTGFTGIKEADMWYLVTGFTVNDGTARDPISANLARVPTSHHFEMIGSGMTEDAGIFTFPQTGKYIIRLHIGFAFNGDMRYITAVIDGVISSSVVSNLAKVYTHIAHAERSTTYGFATGQCVFDCQNTTTHKVQFAIDERTQDASVSSGLGFTNMQFFRIGDT